ncbi:lipid II flippase Amj family protein [Brevibacillus sp. H7]|uniref:lipid II flippase Amj family protein n=1 Tax=Brevibacillus sp. H7 TaxID=3349138 RepID=UPI0038216F04
MEHVWLICLFTSIIHTTETLSYAVRLAGVRTGKLAVALSLTGMILLVSRTSNLIQAPMTGALIDQAMHMHLDVSWHFRFIIAAASAGTVTAILLFPTFVQLSRRLIAHLEMAGSIPQLLKNSVSVESIRHVRQHIRIPRLQALSRFRIKGIPKRLLLLNCIVTAIYTVSILSTLYASLISPDFKATILMSSGLINGFATIILTILVDPQVALLTDRAMNGQTEPDTLREIYIWLMISRFLGTLLAQLLFIPAAYWVAWIGPLFH